MITLRDISIGYPAREALLTDVNATFSAGTLTALIGRNGTGKSTLLRTIAGIERPLSGCVEIEGKAVHELSAPQRAKLVAYVSTTRTRIPAMRCKDAVAAGRAPYTGWTGRLSDRDRCIVQQSLADTEMSDYSDRLIDTLSDGEWQRIMIARALAQQTPVIILDEPTSFLDIPNREMLSTLLSDLAHDSGRTILYSTHELETALRHADTIALLDRRTLTTYPTQLPDLPTILSQIFHL